MPSKKKNTLADQTHQVLPTRSATDPAATRALAVEVARGLSDDKCTDVVVLDVAGLSQVCDVIVIASGTSDRQMRAAAMHAEDTAAAMGFPTFRKSIDDRTTWIALDFVECVVHVFEPNARAQYDLEMLWGDARHVEWQRPKK
ncbi:MAG: ribosome silencing factor [Phycisphaeraceae bacterium]|nr:ribosome silencing factor [Phycisphaeraceae bacterium]